MARARNIKPGLYKNEDLAECSVWARLIFPGLWMLADREGRLEDRPKRIKGELLPFDSQDVEPLLEELDRHKFILRYEVAGVRYLKVVKFLKHQTPHYSEKASIIPPPFQESTSDEGSKFQEHSAQLLEKPAIKRGSQPPDSLIPDSLIADSLIPDPLIAGATAPGWIRPDLWQDFKKHRGAKFTAKAQALILKKLQAFKDEGQDPNAILENSIASDWKGVFPETRAHAGGNKQDALERHCDDVARQFAEARTGHESSALPGVSRRESKQDALERRNDEAARQFLEAGPVEVAKAGGAAGEP